MVADVMLVHAEDAPVHDHNVAKLFPEKLLFQECT
jgi:hypothetical protein